MRINDDCTGCGICLPFCPVGAILDDGDRLRVDENQCVECGVCRRSADCPTAAFFQPPESDLWPRVLRKQFSDPTVPHPHTRGFGRGTEEMKTNDVTGRYRRGTYGMALEFGRPGIATRLGDVEKATQALAGIGVRFEEKNPVYALFDNPATGTFTPEVRNERVLSAIVEAGFPARELPRVLAAVRQVAQEIDSVFSLDLITRFEPDGTIAVLPELARLGFPARSNAKINLGLGRPRAPSDE
ncbi:MAG: 4Fe-4S binding protein [Chloroflexi bacterium]|nr:4Fe-4S binding protein [Chloroflexota bacterium]